MLPDRFGWATQALMVDTPTFVLEDSDNGKVIAAFDLIENSREKYGKNLNVVFAPDQVAERILQPDDVARLSTVIYTIFSHLIGLTAQQRLNMVKIHSHDDILVACFGQCASLLEQNGYCNATLYGKWIEVRNISSVPIDRS